MRLLPRPGLIFGALLAAVLLPATLTAAERTLRLDPATTHIHFTLDATLHTVEGTVKLKAGKLRVNPETRTLTGRIVIDAASAETAKDGRDKKMHADVLETERYPQIVLHPERYEGTLAAAGVSTLTVFGQLELHGTKHAIELPVTVTTTSDGVKAQASLVIPYVEWGLEDPSTFVLRVAKEVKVTVRAQGRWSDSAPGAPE